MKIPLCALISLLTISGTLWGGEEIRIVTTTTVLADIAGEIAGNAAGIEYVASPKRNLHYVEPTPKDVLRVKKADVFIYHGLQGEPWLAPLLNAAGNPRFLVEGSGIIDASKGVHPIEVPDSLSRLQGDIHPSGNPHYWLDPENAKIMADNIAKGLAQVLPAQSDIFWKNADAFKMEIDEKMREWKQRLSPYQGEGVVTYHRSASYFAKRFGFRLTGEIEPKPGIPPSPKHLEDLIRTMQEQKVRLILTEPYFELRTPERLARDTGAAVVEFLQFPGARKGAKDYLSMMETNVSEIEKALAEGNSK